MDYATMLAKRVLDQNPKDSSESVRVLNEILSAEDLTGYSTAGLAELRISIADAAREIVKRKVRRQAS